ncbi:MAG: hypothetical protein AAB421_01305 [Patescibacteria group bacterium]
MNEIFSASWQIQLYMMLAIGVAALPLLGLFKVVSRPVAMLGFVALNVIGVAVLVTLLPGDFRRAHEDVWHVARMLDLTTTVFGVLCLSLLYLRKEE